MRALWHGLVLDRLVQGGISDWRARQVALGVAAWCADETGPKACPDVRLDQWLAHALCAVGQHGDAGFFSPCRDGFGLGEHLAPPLFFLMREGILHFRQTGADGPEWRLDVDRLTGAYAGCELGVCRVLLAALIHLGRTWKQGGASPRLMLTGLPRLARRMEGPRASVVNVRRRAKWIRGYIRDVLFRRCPGPVFVGSLDLVA